MTGLPQPAPRITATLALVIMAFLVICMTGTAHAAPKKTSETDTTASTPKKSRAVKIKQQNRSGETTAERERRLTRECKGMPNAGACLGYASR